jgi:hypothetical protein
MSRVSNLTLPTHGTDDFVGRFGRPQTSAWSPGWLMGSSRSSASAVLSNRPESLPDARGHTQGQLDLMLAL